MVVGLCEMCLGMLDMGTKCDFCFGWEGEQRLHSDPASP